MPVTRASEPVIGVDSTMSKALPAGGPSKISVSTTSASSRSTIRCAVVDPTNPPPTTVTFFRILSLSSVGNSSLCSLCAVLCALCVNSFSFLLPRHRLPLHILNNRASKRRSPHLRRPWHQPLQVVRHALLLNRPRDPIFDKLRGLFPAQKLKHHRPRKHH